MSKDSEHSNSIEELYDLYHVDVYRFLRTFTGNESDAEDLTQETFMQLMKDKQINSLDQKRNPKTWILTIAKYKAIDHHRKRKFLIFFQDKIINQIPGVNLNPDLITSKNETKQELMDSINSLKTDQKLAVVLRGINELSISETASVLNWSESKVKTTYHRAIKQLEKSMNCEIKGGILHEDAR